MAGAMVASDGRAALELWRAVASVPTARPEALAALTASFRVGSVPTGLRGPHRGRLVATTLDRGLDLPAELLARLWTPWKGKTFDADRGEGWNLFTPGFRRLARLLWPSYGRFQAHGPDRVAGFRFFTEVGASALDPGREVLRIVYDLPENPPLVRSVVDELVRVEEGLYLGQALRPWRGRVRRAGWFLLEPESPSAGLPLAPGVPRFVSTF